MAKKLSVLQVLRKARARVARGWCQRDLAKTKGGRSCNPTDKEAARFCAYGALDSLGYDTADATLVLRTFVPRGHIASFNDAPGRKKSEVVALFDKAIAKVKQKK